MKKIALVAAIAICLAGPALAQSALQAAPQPRAAETGHAGCPQYSTLPRAQAILERLAAE